MTSYKILLLALALTNGVYSAALKPADLAVITPPPSAGRYDAAYLGRRQVNEFADHHYDDEVEEEVEVVPTPTSTMAEEEKMMHFQDFKQFLNGIKGLQTEFTAPAEYKMQLEAAIPLPRIHTPEPYVTLTPRDATLGYLTNNNCVDGYYVRFSIICRPVGADAE